MPDVVVVRLPKDQELAEKSPPPPPTLLAKLRRAFGLPIRAVWRFLLRIWRRFFGLRPKP